MAGERSVMWGDWESFRLPGLLWFFNQAAPSSGFTARPLLASDIFPDSLDASADPTVQGGATSKVALTTVNSALGLSGYMIQLAMPDFVINKQREFGLADWDGLRNNAMGDDSSARRAIQIENVIVAKATAGQAAPLTTLAKMALSVKFRGYGAPLAGFGQTEDTPVGPVSLNFGVGSTAFPDMALPGDPGGVNAAVSFPAGDGSLVARIQHLVEIPNTSGPGDVMEIIAALALPQGIVTGTGVQWYGAKYRYITLTGGGSYPIDPNTGAQLFTADDEGQPRTDERPFEP